MLLSVRVVYPECHGTIYNIACAIFLCFRVVLIYEFISLLVVTFYFQVRITFKAKLNSLNNSRRFQVRSTFKLN